MNWFTAMADFSWSASRAPDSVLDDSEKTAVRLRFSVFKTWTVHFESATCEVMSMSQ
jgi:hypothetical protein